MGSKNTRTEDAPVKAQPNPVRTCIGCTQTDDHPRHVVAMPGDVEVNWHMDCHAIATGCEICTGIVASSNGVTGDKLRAHLTKGK